MIEKSYKLRHAIFKLMWIHTEMSLVLMHISNGKNIGDIENADSQQKLQFLHFVYVNSRFGLPLVPV